MTSNRGKKSTIILVAAKKVFSKEGYHGASISRIAKEAGVGDGTIYLYFNNKEDILISLFHNTIYHHFTPSAEKLIEQYSDARLKLFELVKHHLSYFQNDYDLARVIQIEARQSSPNIREAMKEGIRRYSRLIESIILKGQEDQIFRRDISERVMRKVIFGAIDEVVTSWVISENRYPLTEKTEEVFKLLLQAVYNIQWLDFWLQNEKKTGHK
jgi:TetR/AcrR family transcriptional regulator, fatty acid metabolism regulator protein